MKVAVVILNWNGVDYLKQFLPLVLAKSNKASVVIADNASSDTSIEYIQQNHPEVLIIPLEQNYGFAEGYNKALKQIDADYFVILNSDVEVTDNWIEPAIALMENDHSIAACQPKVLALHDKDKFEYAGAAGGFIDQFGYPFCRGRMFLSLEKDQQQYPNNTEIFWATGACMFVRAKAFREAGGFDPDFFAHMEEIDLCWRMKRMGKKIMYTPASTVYHIGGGTLPKTSPRKTYLNFRNSLSLLLKNAPAASLPFILFSRLILDGIAGLKFLISGDFLDCIAVIKAHFSFYIKIPSNIQKRSAFSFKEKNPNLVGIYRGNIVIEYYLKGKKKFTDLKGNFQ